VARVKWQPTAKEIKFIQEMKENAQSDTAISKGLGINRGTYTKYRDQNKQIEHAIKAGNENRMDKLLAMATDALEELLSTAEYTETTKIKKDYAGVKSTEEKTVTKKRTPNATITMFTLVNKDPQNWQSINNKHSEGDNIRDTDLPKGATIELLEDGDGGNFSYDD